MDANALSRAMEKDRKTGLIRFFVCATVGTTSSNTIDPLSHRTDLPRVRSLDACGFGNVRTAALCPEFVTFTTALSMQTVIASILISGCSRTSIAIASTWPTRSADPHVGYLAGVSANRRPHLAQSLIIATGRFLSGEDFAHSNCGLCYAIMDRGFHFF